MPTLAVKEACDACRRRKVKCNAQRPCGPCRTANLACRTSGIRRKKGRQGSTANVLRELRKAPDPTQPPTTSHSPQSAPGTGTGAGCSFVRTPGLLEREVVQSCSEYFFARMLGTVPILAPDTFQRHVERMSSCLHSYTLVAAFCAFVLTQTGYASWHASESASEEDTTLAGAGAGVGVDATCPSTSASNSNSGGPSPELPLGRALLDEATVARRHLDPFSGPVRYGIIISFLLYGCQIGMGHQRHAYYFLREATTLYTAGLGVLGQDEGDEGEEVMKGNLFYLLLISERAHAIRRHRPITLQITPDSPVLDDSGSDAFTLGFRCLVDLYRLFDESFLSRWNGTATSSCSPESLIRLEEHLQQAVPADLDLPDILLADLRVSQQWLRTMIWQLATTAGLLSSTPSHPSLDFRYPLQIARDLSLATWKLSRESMETHGVGLIEKVFEVACTLTDVMACLSTAGLRSSGFDLGPQDYLKHFFSLLHTLPGGQRKFLPLLLTKVGQTLPAMLAPISRHLSLPLADLDLSEVDKRSIMGLAEGWDREFTAATIGQIGIGEKEAEIDPVLQFG